MSTEWRDMREYARRTNQCQAAVAVKDGLGICRKPLAFTMTHEFSASQPCCEEHAKQLEKWGWKREQL